MKHAKLTSIFSFTGTGNASKCYGNLGCLHITEDWYGLTRPVNVLPHDRHIINTRFLLTTRESLNQPRFLNLSQPLTITTSTFKGTRPTKIIIHGFIDTGFVPWCSVSRKVLDYKIPVREYLKKPYFLRPNFMQVNY